MGAFLVTKMLKERESMIFHRFELVNNHRHLPLTTQIWDNANYILQSRPNTIRGSFVNMNPADVPAKKQLNNC